MPGQLPRGDTEIPEKGAHGADSDSNQRTAAPGRSSAIGGPNPFFMTDPGKRMFTSEQSRVRLES